MKKSIVIILTLIQAFIFPSYNYAVQIIGGYTSTSKKSTISTGAKSFSNPSSSYQYQTSAPAPTSSSSAKKTTTTPAATGKSTKKEKKTSSTSPVTTQNNNTPAQPQPKSNSPTIIKVTPKSKAKTGAAAVGNGVRSTTTTQSNFNNVTSNVGSNFSNSSVIKKETNTTTAYKFFPYQSKSSTSLKTSLPLYNPWQSVNLLGVSPLATSPDKESSLTLQGSNLTKASDSAFVNFLINRLESRYSWVKEIAKKWLVAVGEPAVEPLSEALNNPANSVSMRQEVAEVLGRIGGTEAIQALIVAFLGDENNSTTEDALFQIGEPAVGPLSEALSNPANSVSIRQDAAWLLGRIGSPEAIESAITVVVDKKDNLNVRILSVWLLAQIGSPEGREALITALGDENEDLRSAAASALGRIGGSEAIEALITALGDENEDVRSAVKDALVQIGEPAVGPLSEALSNPANSVSMRRGSAGILGRIGGANAEAIEALITALGDEDTGVRSTVKAALVQIGESVAEPLKAALTDNDPLVRQGARQILVAFLGNSEFRTYLTEAIKNEDKSTLRQYLLEESLAKVDEALIIIEQIAQTYQIKADDRFDVTHLQYILTILQVFSTDNLEGLGKIDFIPEMAWRYRGHYIPADDPSNTSGAAIIELTMFDGDSIVSDFFHELGHFFDDTHFDFLAYNDLYNKETHLEDFAYEYGQKDSLEDFATTFEVYCLDTKDNFLRALTQAQEGKPAYLEKLLLVLDFFTKGHPEYAIIYRTESGSVKQMKLALTTDGTGEITHIQGVSVIDLKGLENLFKTFNF